MTRSPFPKSPTRKNSSGALPIAQFLILGTVIIIFAAIFVQNLQPLVQVFFLGQKTLPIPLSIAMLVAFVIGGLIAFVMNAIASYQQNTAIRRAIAAADSQSPESNREVKKEVKQPSEPNNFTSNYQSPSPPKSQPKPVPEFGDDEQGYDDEEYEDDWEDETDDWEDEYEEEEYEDPDTVPYGDRKNLKSAQPNREKRDRPPLDARYIR